jgi:hypothetical protein
MKLKVLLIAAVALLGLYFLNRSMNAKKEYIPGVPAADKPVAGAPRGEFTVGFLPVT